MLMTLGQQVRAWLRSRMAPARPITPIRPQRPVPVASAPEPPPLPHEVLIDLEVDECDWQDDSDEERKVWEAAFRLDHDPHHWD